MQGPPLRELLNFRRNTQRLEPQTMAQDRDRVVDHYLLRQLNRRRRNNAPLYHLSTLFLVEAVLPILQPQEQSRSKPGVDRQAGGPSFEAVVYLQSGVPIHDRRILVQEGHRVVPFPGCTPLKEPSQRVQHHLPPFEPKLCIFSLSPHLDTNEVRTATDAGEDPLMDPYIRREAHRNLFASPGTVD